MTSQQASRGGSREPQGTAPSHLALHKRDSEPHKYTPRPSCTHPRFNCPLDGAPRLPACSSHPGHERKHRGTAGGDRDRGLDQRCLKYLIFPFVGMFYKSLGRGPHSEGPWCISFTSFTVGPPLLWGQLELGSRIGPDVSILPCVRASLAQPLGPLPRWGHLLSSLYAGAFINVEGTYLQAPSHLGMALPISPRWEQRNASMSLPGLFW